MTTLDEALAFCEPKLDAMWPEWATVVAAARNWQTLSTEARELDYEASRAVAIRRLGTPRTITAQEIIAAALHIEPGQQTRVIVLDGNESADV